ncbi:MAG: hypothetical protein U0821_09570 [Chloroflexota bacterium]
MADVSPAFANDDEAGEHYLRLLQHGTRLEKLEAREGLGDIMARRGLMDEAADAYETNIRQGVRTRALYEKLADVYERQGRMELASEVRLEIPRLPGEATPEPVVIAPEPAPDPLELDTSRFEPEPPRSTGRRPVLVDDFALAEPEVPTLPDIDGQMEEPLPWYARPGVIVLALLFCSIPYLPIGLTLMWAQARWSNSTKWIITGVFWGVWLAAIGAVAQSGVLLATLPMQIAAGLPGAPTPVISKPTVPSGLPPVQTAPAPPGIAINPGASPSPAVRPPLPPGIAPTGVPAAGPPKVRVAKTEGSGASMRERPSPDANRIKVLNDGTTLDIVGPDETGTDGRLWRRVRDAAGATGFVVADFLETIPPAQAPPAAKPG